MEDCPTADVLWAVDHWFWSELLLTLCSAEQAPPPPLVSLLQLVTAALDLLLICLIEVSLHSKLKVTLWYVQAWVCECVCARLVSVYPLSVDCTDILSIQTNPTSPQCFITLKQTHYHHSSTFSVIVRYKNSQIYMFDVFCACIHVCLSLFEHATLWSCVEYFVCKLWK